MVTSHSFPFFLATPILAAFHHCFISSGVSRCDKNGMIIYSLHLFLSRSMDPCHHMYRPVSAAGILAPFISKLLISLQL
ncbi:hypothetical protein BD769DRAFT_1494998, partial [Suillus cothurnatus]